MPPAVRFYQVIVAGKLRAQRAKSMKFRDGYMIKSGRVREGEYQLVLTVVPLFCREPMVLLKIMFSLVCAPTCCSCDDGTMPLYPDDSTSGLELTA